MPKIYGEVNRKPDWLKIRLHEGQGFAEVAKIVRDNSLHTICSSGKCPNQAECWSRRTATFMILGDICTRACKFCATKTGKPLPSDPHEPAKIARSVKIIELKYCVLTSVDRDDLADKGAGHWAEVVRSVRKENPDTQIEILIPDFDGNKPLLDVVMASTPDVIGHNIETVRRLTPLARSKADYKTSLDVLKHISSSGFTAKSGIMAGLGETDEEILQTVDDLAEAGCSILTIGQYLQPTKRHLPVERYVEPEKFEYYKQEALKRGLAHVESSPLVRSSYLADRAASKFKISNR
ncbi:MAG: lipoyl synthase [Rikenellaceae bacterium]|nr:lipoyl synthase [Rikenellaceae bacterium]